MHKTDLALYLSALGLIAPHLSLAVIVVILLYLLIRGADDE
jgi:hypothetical protein